jgi:hypothetical protein
VLARSIQPCYHSPMPAPAATTYDELTLHLSNLRWAARMLLHAVIDDGCDCFSASVLCHSGKQDWKATMKRDAAYPHRLANPHTVWGTDACWTVSLLRGTDYEITEIPLDRLDLRETSLEDWASYSWPHPSPLADVALANEITPATAIDALEPAMRAVLLEHVTGVAVPGLAYTDAVKTLQALLIGTDSQYGAEAL